MTAHNRSIGFKCEGKNVLLSPRRDLAVAAANLFSYLRELDARRPACIAVAPIPHEGLGEVSNDRLARAAAPRPKAGRP